VIADLGDLKELRQECHQERNPHNGRVDRLAPLYRGKDLTFLMEEVQVQAWHGDKECDPLFVPQTCKAGPEAHPLDHQECRWDLDVSLTRVEVLATLSSATLREAWRPPSL